MSNRWMPSWAAVLLALAASLLLGCRRGGETPSKPPATQSAPANRAPRAGDAVTNSLGMKLLYVPAGTFTMGSPLDEAGRHDDEVSHPVTISRGFYIGATEVTQAQWQAVMGFNRSETTGENLPVSRLSWHHAVTFCKKLSQAEGRTVRLPTEAEWEYACRAGSAEAFAGTGKVDEMGWHMDNSDERPHRVATKKPNAWGLYDLHGNVAEWCADRYARELPAGAARDPAGPATGTYRVARGGSWGHFARAARSAARASFNPAYQLDTLGLRVVMEPTQPKPGR